MKTPRVVSIIAFCLISLSCCSTNQEYTFDQLLEAANDSVKDGQFESACKYFQMAIDQAEKDDVNDPRIATVVSYYGALQASNKRFADAELLYKNALDIQQRLLPANSPDIKQTQENLLAVLERQSKTKEVKELQFQIKNAGKGKTKAPLAVASKRVWPTVPDEPTKDLQKEREAQAKARAAASGEPAGELNASPFGGH